MFSFISVENISKNYLTSYQDFIINTSHRFLKHLNTSSISFKLGASSFNKSGGCDLKN